MFYYDKNTKLVTDGQRRIVGVVVNDRFKQDNCDPIYRPGLGPRELDKISELLQRSGVQY